LTNETAIAIIFSVSLVHHEIDENKIFMLSTSISRKPFLCCFLHYFTSCLKIQFFSPKRVSFTSFPCPFSVLPRALFAFYTSVPAGTEARTEVT